jgi:hypothetical protein
MTQPTDYPAIATLTFDPDDVTISWYATQRYQQRRNTSPEAAHHGIMRLTKASQLPMPPLRMAAEPTRHFNVNGFNLVLTADCRVLPTLYADSGLSWLNTRSAKQVRGGRRFRRLHPT